MREKNSFICFTGIDGSGKTTACKKFINTLEEKGFRYNYVYCGWRRFDSFVLVPFVITLKKLNILFTKRLHKNTQNSKQWKARNDYLKSHFPTLFRNIVLMDYFLNVFFRIKIPLLSGKNIVCDRYIYDVIINLGIDLGYSNERIEQLLEKFIRLTPEPDIVFLLDVPEEVSFNRKDDIPSIGHLVRPRSMYLNLPERYHMIKIDGRKNLDEINTITYKSFISKHRDGDYHQ